MLCELALVNLMLLFMVIIIVQWSLSSTCTCKSFVFKSAYTSRSVFIPQYIYCCWLIIVNATCMHSLKFNYKLVSRAGWIIWV